MHREPFTLAEKAKLCLRLKKLQPAVDPMGVEFAWARFRFKDTCGMFIPPGTICFNRDVRLAMEDGGMDDVVCHELRHVMQYREQGWLRYSLRNLTRINELEAYAEQEGDSQVIAMMNEMRTHKSTV